MGAGTALGHSSCQSFCAHVCAEDSETSKARWPPRPTSAALAHEDLRAFSTFSSSSSDDGCEVRLPHAAAGGRGGGWGAGRKVGAAPFDAGQDLCTGNYFLREDAELRAEACREDAARERLYRRRDFRTGAAYAGQWRGSLRDGFGTQTWPDGASYRGQWELGAASGLGTFQHGNGDCFTGEWRGNVAHGRGVFRRPCEGTTFAGQFVDDLQEGSGVETCDGQPRYVGQFLRGRKHGLGVHSWPDGSTYVGRWSANLSEGPGAYTGQDGQLFRGMWCGSLMHGPGQCVWPDGRRYEGQHADDAMQGFGVFAWTDGRRYEGHWRAGRQHGSGRLHVEDGSRRPPELSQWADGLRAF